jgi:hypothetical protein
VSRGNYLKFNIMGLLGLLGIGGSKTKSDWDDDIQRLNRTIAHWQSELARAQANKNKIFAAECKKHIAYYKAELANAKINRKNAPKG